MKLKRMCDKNVTKWDQKQKKQQKRDNLPTVQKEVG